MSRSTAYDDLGGQLPKQPLAEVIDLNRHRPTNHAGPHTEPMSAHQALHQAHERTPSAPPSPGSHRRSPLCVGSVGTVPRGFHACAQWPE